MPDGPDRESESDAIAFLLVRLGAHAAARFAGALEPVGIEPRHYGLLMRLAAHEGSSQQELGALLGLNPTRMVFLIDDLEAQGLVERRPNPADRRRYALHLTVKGTRTLRRAQTVARRQSAAVGETLTVAERRQLAGLLEKLVAGQGLPEEGLPVPGRLPARPAD